MVVIWVRTHTHWQRPDIFEVTAEVPGFARDQISVEVNGRTLIISARVPRKFLTQEIVCMPVPVGAFPFSIDAHSLHWWHVSF